MYQEKITMDFYTAYKMVRSMCSSNRCEYDQEFEFLLNLFPTGIYLFKVNNG